MNKTLAIGGLIAAVGIWFMAKKNKPVATKIGDGNFDVSYPQVDVLPVVPNTTIIASGPAAGLNATNLNDVVVNPVAGSYNLAPATGGQSGFSQVSNYANIGLIQSDPGDVVKVGSETYYDTGWGLANYTPAVAASIEVAKSISTTDLTNYVVSHGYASEDQLAGMTDAQRAAYLTSFGTEVTNYVGV